MMRFVLISFLLFGIGTTALAGTTIVSAVLPNARSVEVGRTATAFAVIINSGAEIATNCKPVFDGAFTGQFGFQTSLPPKNVLTGTPNTPADIAPGEAQFFVFSIRPDEAFDPVEMGLSLECDNAVAPRSVSVNTFLLGSSATPVPDIIPIISTLSHDGIVRIKDEVFFELYTASAINIGAGDNGGETAMITVVPSFGAFSSAAGMVVCVSDPNTGTCADGGGLLDRPQASATLAMGPDPVTFTVLVKADSITFWPEFARVGLDFIDVNNTLRSSVGAAVIAPDVAAGAGLVSQFGPEFAYNIDGGWNVRMTPSDPLRAPFNAKLVVVTTENPETGLFASRLTLVHDPADRNGNPAQGQVRFLSPVTYDVRADGSSRVTLAVTGAGLSLDYFHQGRISGSIHVDGSADWTGTLQGLYDPAQGFLRISSADLQGEYAAHTIDGQGSGRLQLTAQTPLFSGIFETPDVRFSLSGDFSFDAGVFGVDVANCVFGGTTKIMTTRRGSLGAGAIFIAAEHLPRMITEGGLSACGVGVPDFQPSGVLFRYNPIQEFNEPDQSRNNRQAFMVNARLRNITSIALGVDLPGPSDEVRFGYVLIADKIIATQ